MRKILIALAAMPLGAMLSCQNQHDSQVPTPTAAAMYVEGSSGERYDPALENFARTLAASMTDPSMREFVKVEAEKAFDGDFDVLVQQVTQQRVKASTFEQTMVQAATKQAGGNARISSSLVRDYVRQQPLLNIAVPVHIDAWEAAKYEPLVAVSPTIDDESKVRFIKAFDSKGKIHWLNGRTPPEQPVVVVGLNERVRMDATGQMKVIENLIPVGRVYSKPTAPVADYLPGTKTPDAGKGGRVAGACSFAQNALLQIPRMECNNIASVESWDRGLPEICFEAISADKDANFNALKRVARVAYMPQYPSYREKNKWFAFGPEAWQCYSVTDVIYWTDLHGDVLFFQFWEQDNGGDNTTIKFTAGGSIGDFKAGVEIPLQLGDGDDQIGYKFLYRCEPQSLRYLDGQPLITIQRGNSEFWIFFRSA